MPSSSSEVQTLCKRDPNDPYAFDYYNCLHGIGHGVTIRFKNDCSPASRTATSSRRTGSARTAHRRLHAEHRRRPHDAPVRAPEPDDPVYPCNAVEDKWKYACYLSQTSYILRQLDYDYEKGFEVCDSIEEDYISTCYISMGRDISGNSHREAAKVLERCSLGDPTPGVVLHRCDPQRGLPRPRDANADALCAIVPERYRPRCESARDSAAESL